MWTLSETTGSSSISAGNRYRLVVHFSYKFKTALIKFVGTHKEYDSIDAETV